MGRPQVKGDKHDLYMSFTCKEDRHQEGPASALLVMLLKMMEVVMPMMMAMMVAVMIWCW